MHGIGAGVVGSTAGGNCSGSVCIAASTFVGTAGLKPTTSKLLSSSEAEAEDASVDIDASYLRGLSVAPVGIRVGENRGETVGPGEQNLS